MHINWKVRLKNPTFWRNIVVAVGVTTLAKLGMEWQQITSWGALLEALQRAVSNPVIVAAVIGVVWNALNDPTTAGDSDSARALGYAEPQK